MRSELSAAWGRLISVMERNGTGRAGRRCAAGLLILVGAAAAAAQTHKVAKPEKVVRAVGVYEWTGDLKKPKASRLVPVTIFIDGELRDAGVYLPQPIPFALLPGNEYELEHAGVVQGLFEVDSARHFGSTDAGDEESWLGYGSYRPEVVKHDTPLRASRTQPVVTGGSGTSDRPTLVRKTGSDTTPGAANGGTGAGTTPAADPDRPTMHRRGDTSSTGSTAGSEVPAAPADDPDRPTLKRRTADTGKKSKGKDEDTPSVTAAGVMGTDPDRPMLHRGRPAGGSAAADAAPATIVGTPADLQQVAAVSDAATRPEHDFARAWEDAGERAGVLAKMQAIARTQLATYPVLPGATVGASATSAKPTSASPSAAATARSRAAARSRAGRAAPGRAAPAPVLALLDEQLKGYTLSYGGAATYIYTAHTAGTGADLRYVTVVAQAEVTGDLKPAMSSVTDAAHLDRVPWMRFVDAVDAEASNRASLLFELRGQNSRQFAVYQVLGDRADQLLATGAMH